MDSLVDFAKNLVSSEWFTGVIAAIGVSFGVYMLQVLLKTRSTLDTLAAKREEEHKQLQTLKLELETSGDSKESAGQEVEASLVPPVPEGLIEACASGSCVLMTGGGVSSQAGLPTWRETLLTLSRTASLRKGNEGGADLRDAINSGRLAQAEEVIASRLPREDLITQARVLYRHPREALPPLCVSLSGIGFAGVLTTNWDSVLESTFAGKDPLVVRSSHSKEVEELVEEKRFFIVKLYGDPAIPETFRFTPKEYEQDLFENETYSKFLASLFLTRTVFFVGTSLKGIEDFLSGLKLRGRPARLHFALVPREGDWALQEEFFRQRYNVQLLGYVPTPGFPEVTAFVESLRGKVAARDTGSERGEIQEATLNRVTLKNIGVFEELDLELNDGWNILLGNNGSGKSTLLKAIALGLCGDDALAAEAGKWLLRADAPSGFIRLRVGKEEYLTELFREPDRVRVRCEQLTPVQRGNWVVLGFPAMRGVSTRNPEGPAGRSARRPAVQDLLPLIGGAVDSRMDNVKQWVVNVDAEAVPRRGRSEAEAARNAQLRDAFFGLLRKLSPSRLDIEFDSVDSKNNWQVMVKAGGVSIPIDQVSQGMSSMFGWVGTLLQRMYEIHYDSERPEQEAALVLVDEIDAHLHPEWQQLLVPLVKSEFRKLQLIATTHSPLLVAGMKAKEVWIARPDETGKGMKILPAPLDFEGMRADQILTSPAFGLMSSRSHETRQDIDRYAEMLGRKTELERRQDELKKKEGPRPEAEQGELLSIRAELAELEMKLPELERKLEGSYKLGETERERQVAEALRKAVVAELPGAESSAPPLTPEVELEISKQLAEIFTPRTKAK